MKQKSLALWILALFIIVDIFGAVSCIVASNRSAREARRIREIIATSDHKFLLDACREMMAKRKHYRYIADDDFITFGPESEQYSNDVPEIIRSMTPICVSVSKRQVIVRVPGQQRTGFVGYANDSDRPPLEQIDRFTLLTNGLWMYKK